MKELILFFAELPIWAVFGLYVTILLFGHSQKIRLISILFFFLFLFLAVITKIEGNNLFLFQISSFLFLIVAIILDYFNWKDFLRKRKERKIFRSDIILIRSVLKNLNSENVSEKRILLEKNMKSPEILEDN